MIVFIIWEEVCCNMEFRKIPSLDYKYEINEDGTIFRNVKTKYESKIKLDMHHSKKGYYMVFVHIGGRRPDAYCKRVMIHRAVAECWLGPCPNGMEVDHKNRDSLDNHYSNLRYVTKGQQMKNRDHTNIAAKGCENLRKARESRMKGVIISKGDEIKEFKSISECSKYLSTKLNYTSEKIRYYLRIQKPNYGGYDLKYL